MISRKRRVAILGLLLVSFGIGFTLMRHARLSETFHDLCDLVEEKFYLDDHNLASWENSCHLRARQLSFFVSLPKFLKQVQEQMDLMHVSHFMIYSPVEDQKLWKGEAAETGLRARWMEDHMIVYQVLPRTPAFEAGFQVGDEVLAINGRAPNASEDVWRAGHYQIDRDGKKQMINVLARPILIDSAPTLKRLSPDAGLVTISSFRKEYFDGGVWKSFVRDWSHYHRLIFDLRENAGGNFVAMLRALSPLMCHPKLIGQLQQPRRSYAQSRVLEDDLSDDVQISELDESGTVLLKTYPGYGCFEGSVAVLIGPHTSSVSEIFSSAISLRPHSRVFGQPSAGDVVLAIWYDLPNLGPGYSVSIPEASFINVRGENLEGIGVQPQKEVFDDLRIWRRGHDSWIKAAMDAKF